MIQSVSTSAPSSTSATPSLTGQTLGKNDFLKLLITQLQNQDPLNPLDQNQFLAQTAQFTQLEDLQNISSQLSDMTKLSQGQSFAQGAALLGKTATANGQDFTLGNGPATLPYVTNGAANVQVQILDTQGNVVRQLTASALDAGSQSVTWDGLDSAGRSLAAGTYHYRVTADGNALAAVVQGTLTGLSPSGNGVSYHIGNAVVRPDDLIDIS
jgi:flagellar basal-body rod modification protein FlgD